MKTIGQKLLLSDILRKYKKIWLQGAWLVSLIDVHKTHYTSSPLKTMLMGGKLHQVNHYKIAQIKSEPPGAWCIALKDILI